MGYLQGVQSDLMMGVIVDMGVEGDDVVQNNNNGKTRMFTSAIKQILDEM